MGIVVLCELPRDRSTLLLRLLGAGPVQRGALEDLEQLPRDAWDRQVAQQALLAIRIEIPHDSADEGDREFLMSTQNLYEEWERKTREQGSREGEVRGSAREARRAFTIVYQSRFGSLPHALADALEATSDIATLERWLSHVGTRSQDEIAAAVRAERPPLQS